MPVASHAISDIAVEQPPPVCRYEAGVEVELVVEPSRVRPTDIPFLVADVRKTRKELGWKTGITLEETLRDMFN